MDIKERFRVWREMAAKLKRLKADEMTARKSIVDEFFPNAKKGTSRVTAADYELKCVVKYNASVDTSVLLAIKDTLTAEERACIEWKPSLKEGAYNKLSQEQRARLAEAVTFKPASPALEITPLEVE